MEFNCAALQRLFEEYGVTHRLAMPYTPEQNGAAEQESHTIVESASCMRHACGLLVGLWAEASNTAVYIIVLDLHQWNCGLDPSNSWSLLCFRDRMFCAHPQTEKSQVGPKEYVG
jgi:transposase InsO family protein